MSESKGRWVDVPLPDGTVRHDWRPDEQPPAPDDSPGSWHVVTQPGTADRWEWVAVQPALVPAAAVVDSMATTSSSPIRAGFSSVDAPASTQKRQKKASVPRGRTLAIGSAILAVGAIGAVAAVALSEGSGSDVVVRAPLAPLQADVVATLGSYQVVAGANGDQQGFLQVTFVNQGTQPRSVETPVWAASVPGVPSDDWESVQALDLQPGQSTTVAALVRSDPAQIAKLAGAAFERGDVRDVANPRP